MSVRTKRMERLWLQMQAMYGSRWLLEYGLLLTGSEMAPIAEIWAKALDEASNEQIATGLRQCLARDSEHPPSLPEFLRLCGAGSRNQTGAYAALPPSEHPLADIYRDMPADRCARIGAELQAEAEEVLRGKSGANLPESVRRDALRGYWMTKIGESLHGKGLIKKWEQAA